MRREFDSNGGGMHSALGSVCIGPNANVLDSAKPYTVEQILTASP